jgi:hypothetical protein
MIYMRNKNLKDHYKLNIKRLKIIFIMKMSHLQYMCHKNLKYCYKLNISCSWLCSKPMIHTKVLIGSKKPKIFFVERCEIKYRFQIISIFLRL